MHTIASPPSYRSPRRSPRADAALLARFAETRDTELRRRLVDRYLPLARFAAAHFARGPEPIEDLVQVASIGLLHAIDRYDPGKGVAFTSYALPTINGELRRHFRDRGWMIRPPRDLQDDALRVKRITQELLTERRHAPTVEDVARAGALSVEEVLEAREALNARHAASLSPTSGDDESPGLEARLGIIDDNFARVEQRAMLDALGRRVLTRRDRAIVHLRFAHDLTQAEIGDVVGLSQMHVSRVLRVSLDKLRAAAAAS
jgi:RNA polymerase sigma-B factor